MSALRRASCRVLRSIVVAVLTTTALTALTACGGGHHAHHQAGPTQTAASASLDWPLFGRDRDATFFAPQTQINTQSVSRLGLAWSVELGPYQYLNESFPVEIGRTLYITTSSDEVQAYNAVTGKLEWRYAPQVDFSQSTGIGGYGVTTNRGVAIADGRVFELTFDDHLKAVSQSTGEQLWSASVASDASGAYETMAPTVYDGLVIVGVSGSQSGIRGFVAAYDQSTGKQVWRFYTVPPSGTGWTPAAGGGGGVYMPPTVDTRTGLIYAGTSTPAPAIYGVGRKGADLYTDSILALNAHTGRLAWYYQEVPHDLWNYGAASPSMVVNPKVNGAAVGAIAEAGKDGHVYVLDASTGKPLFAPLAYVKVHHPPPTTKGTYVCPGSVGGSPYSPMALEPGTNTAFVSGVNICQILKVEPMFQGGEKEFGGVRFTPPNEKLTGTFDAIDLNTGKFVWQRAMPTPMIGGAVATGGDLVFTGDQHGNLYGIDVRTGKTVWKANLGLAFGSAPIVYSIDGTEYLAAAIGGSATTAASHLGPIGAKLVVLKLGGTPIR
jgi:alcohol dehydrogenase (cytochrome c)